MGFALTHAATHQDLAIQTSIIFLAGHDKHGQHSGRKKKKKGGWGGRIKALAGDTNAFNRSGWRQPLESKAYFFPAASSCWGTPIQCRQLLRVDDGDHNDDDDGDGDVMVTAKGDDDDDEEE